MDFSGDPSDCHRCPDLCRSRSQVVLPDLPMLPNGLLVIGEAPGGDEDREGIGFVGRAGKTLMRLLKEHGLTRGQQAGCANIVRCRPPENRKPTPTEVGNCRPWLVDTIQKARPRVVLAVGSSASGVFYSGGSLSGMMALAASRDFIPDRQGDLKNALQCARVVPMPHTSPLAWNRKSPDGRKWADVGMEQVAIAVAALTMTKEIRHT
jgi:uracil-DNA glycosylase family 4